MRSTLIEEMMAAGRGVIAILRGDKRAPDYFDFTLRGLMGSFIAYIVVVAVGSYLEAILTSADELRISVAARVFASAVVLALQVSLAAILLNQFKRSAGLLPYLIASNWAVFVLGLVDIALYAAGVRGGFPWLVFLCLGIYVTANIGRLILRLQAWQIALLVATDVAGWYFGNLLSLQLTLTPEQWAQLGAQAG